MSLAKSPTTFRKRWIAPTRMRKDSKKTVRSPARSKQNSDPKSRVYILTRIGYGKVIRASTKVKLVMNRGIYLANKTNKEYLVSVHFDRTGKCLDAVVIAPPRILKEIKRAVSSLVKVQQKKTV